ncbi:MAG: mechanosensitive ion channel family protein [Anaerolineae bacterium]
MVDMEPVMAWLADHGVPILLIIIVAFISYRLLRVITRAISRQIQEMDDVEGSDLDKRTITIVRVVNSTGLAIIIGTTLLMVLTELGIAITPVLASVGVVGLAFGLGAQTLVKDMISGLFVLLENQYTVGDFIEIDGLSGVVEVMTLRATIIRDLYGALHIVPNGEIRIVCNKSRDWSRAIVDVSITYDADVDRAVQTLEEIGAAMQEDDTIAPSLLEPAVVTGVEGLDDWAVRLRIMVKTLPGQHWGVQRYLRRRIHLVFAEKGIDLAFPRQDVMVLSPEG